MVTESTQPLPTAVPVPAPTGRTLVTKLAEVMGHVHRVAKNGRNDFHKYDYATEADIADAVRNHMAERHLILVPDVTETKWREVQAKNGPQHICTLHVRFTVHDGDTGEKLEFNALGEGQDSLDKATYKAMTGAVKYALLKLFLIPTGDDPENEEPAPKQKREAKPKPAGGITEEQQSTDKLLKRLAGATSLEDLEKVVAWASAEERKVLYGELWVKVVEPAIVAQREKLKPLTPEAERAALQQVKENLKTTPLPEPDPFETIMAAFDAAEASRSPKMLELAGLTLRNERDSKRLTDEQLKQLISRGAVVKSKLEAPATP